MVMGSLLLMALREQGWNQTLYTKKEGKLQAKNLWFSCNSMDKIWFAAHQYFNIDFSEWLHSSNKTQQNTDDT